MGEIQSNFLMPQNLCCSVLNTPEFVNESYWSSIVKNISIVKLHSKKINVLKWFKNLQKVDKPCLYHIFWATKHVKEKVCIVMCKNI